MSSLNFDDRSLCDKHFQVSLIQMSFGFLPPEGMLNPNHFEESVDMVVDMQDHIGHYRSPMVMEDKVEGDGRH